MSREDTILSQEDNPFTRTRVMRENTVGEYVEIGGLSPRASDEENVQASARRSRGSRESDEGTPGRRPSARLSQLSDGTPRSQHSEEQRVTIGTPVRDPPKASPPQDNGGGEELLKI